MIQFFAQNLIYNSTLTASTVNSQYPVSNLQSDFRTKVWRSTSNSDNLVIDLGAAQEIDAICLSANWQDGFGVSAVTIEANATDSWGSPAFSTTITLDSTYDHAFKVLTSSETYRYWRLVCTSTLGYCELAYIYIGKKTAITTNGLNYNWNYAQVDQVKTQRTVYGQEYFDDYGTRKEITGASFEVMNTTELDQIFEVFDNCRTIKPFFFKFGDDSNTVISDEDRISGLYKLTGKPQVTNISSGFYNTSLGMREQK
jgi:hypothetical protein